MSTQRDIRADPASRSQPSPRRAVFEARALTKVYWMREPASTTSMNAPTSFILEQRMRFRVNGVIRHRCTM